MLSTSVQQNVEMLVSWYLQSEFLAFPLVWLR